MSNEKAPWRSDIHFQHANGDGGFARACSHPSDTGPKRLEALVARRSHTTGNRIAGAHCPANHANHVCWDFWQKPLTEVRIWSADLARLRGLESSFRLARSKP